MVAQLSGALTVRTQKKLTWKWWQKVAENLAELFLDVFCSSLPRPLLSPALGLAFQCLTCVQIPSRFSTLTFLVRLFFFNPFNGEIFRKITCHSLPFQACCYTGKKHSSSVFETAQEYISLLEQTGLSCPLCVPIHLLHAQLCRLLVYSPPSVREGVKLNHPHKTKQTLFITTEPLE